MSCPAAWHALSNKQKIIKDVEWNPTEKFGMHDQESIKREKNEKDYLL